MATIVRIKRRRDEDPLDALVVSCKKQKSLSTTFSEDTKNELKFAGTVSSKNDVISRKIREAIRKEKLEKEYKKRHVDVGSKSRHQQQESTRNARFKIVSEHRALDLDNLDLLCDERNNVNGSKEESHIVPSSCSRGQVCESGGACGTTVRTGSCSCQGSLPGQGHKTENATEQSTKDQEKPAALKKNGQFEVKTKHENGATCTVMSRESEIKRQNDSSDLQSVGSQASSCGSGKVFQLYDVEIEGRPLPSYESLIMESQNSSGITCNSVPMAREVVSNTQGHEEYVYDLYYTNNVDLHLQLLENSLSLATFHHDHQLGNFDDYNDDVYDDDDDENEENNWRNDYPDEDPRYYENDEVDYYYGDDVDPHQAFDHDDDGLSEWMSSRFHLEGGTELSSPDEDVGYDQIMDPFLRGSSYDSFYARVKQEMRDSETDSTAVPDT